jgi:short subunit dehydrogenase-like uncharacterized protein
MQMKSLNPATLFKNQIMSEPIKSIDLLLYGATGFTGRRTASLLVRYAREYGLKITLAGRDAEKLNAVKKSIPQDLQSQFNFVAVRIDQAQELQLLLRQSRVLINTAGPFVRTGPILIPLCIEAKCDYLDITGETPFVRDMIRDYDEEARKNKVRIVPFCGFDSIPSDLGVFLTVKQWTARFPNEPLQRITGLFSARGGINGGTLASVYDLLETGKISEVLSSSQSNLALLSPEKTFSPPVKPDWYGPRRIPGGTSWGVPFFMSPINTRVVRRTQSLMAIHAEDPLLRKQYAEFYYEEGMALSWPLAIVVGPLLGLMFRGAPALSKRKKILAAIWKYLPAPGTGPSEESIQNGFFEIKQIAQGRKGTRLVTSISAQGDPGNQVTVQCLVQSALCLALENRRKLLRPRFGVLTPAFAFGEVLKDGLSEVGFSFRALLADD